MGLNIDECMERVRSNEKFSDRFSGLTEEILGKISRVVLEEIGQDFDRFDEVINLLIGSKIKLPVSHVVTHLNSVKTIADRIRVSSLCDSFESPEYYLAVMGLTAESDPAKISRVFGFLSRENSPERRMYNAVCGGIDLTQDEARKVARSVCSLPEMKDYAASRRGKDPKEIKRSIAIDGQLSFNSAFQEVSRILELGRNHPIGSESVKTCVVKLATNSQQRRATITLTQHEAVKVCYEALYFVHTEALNIKLTSVQRAVNAYVCSPSLNTDLTLMAKYRSEFGSGGKFSYLISEGTSIALCVKPSDSRSAFPDPIAVSMAYSFLNLSVTPREIYTDEELRSAVHEITKALQLPHTGNYIHSNPNDFDLPQWSGGLTEVATRAKRILVNAFARFPLRPNPMPVER